MDENAPPEQSGKKRDWVTVLGMAAVAGATMFTSYSGLADLAGMAGWNSLLAKFLPITVDAYAMTATRVWLSPARLTKKARDFARRSAIAAIFESVAGNALYHAASAHVLSITWPMVVGLSAVPPVTLGLITHLYHVSKDIEPEPQPDRKASPGPAIADPDAVHAAYPVLGDARALALPTQTPAKSSAPGPGPRSAPAPAPRGALAAKPSAPLAQPSAPRPAVASAAPSAPRPAGEALIARSWAEREAQLLPQAREINARELKAGAGPVSARKLAQELHISQANAGKLVKALADGEPGPSARPVPVADAVPRTPAAPAQLVGRPHEQSAPALADAVDAAPTTAPGAPAASGSSAFGPVTPGAFPAQRDGLVTRANGATVETS